MMGNRLAVAVFALATACSEGTGTEVPSPVSGGWHYVGSQDSPTIAQLDGSLSWRGVAPPDGAFEGTFSIVEIPTGAQQRTLAGTSAGQIVADTIASFDIIVAPGGADRHHFGVLRGDSIAGMWTELGGSAASGRFVLHRIASSIQ
jgi:hypothetical protein